MLYRLCTENLNRKKIEKIVSSYFDGFTLFSAIGYWQNYKENSLIIEISSNNNEYDKIKEIAKEIKRVNDQDAVLIQELQQNQTFI